MSRALLNVGLEPNHSAQLWSMRDVCAAAQGLGIQVLSAAQVESDTEPTAVLHCARATDWAIDQLARQLDQQCIAVWRLFEQPKGSLIGPEAAAWGEFNPELFILADGSRLSAHLAKVPA